MAERFDAAVLLGACKKYHHSYGRPKPYWEEPIYRLFVVDSGRPLSKEWAPIAVEYLDLWEAYNYRFKRGGLDRARTCVPQFLERNWSELTRLHRRNLVDYRSDDFGSVTTLMDQLQEELEFRVGRKWYRAPIAAGKLLHFLLPFGVVMWDREYVRMKAYRGLKDTTEDFVKYQKFCQELLRLLLEAEGRRGLTELPAKHSRQCQLTYREPLPKLLDEMAYSASAAKSAIDAVGHPKNWASY